VTPAQQRNEGDRKLRLETKQQNKNKRQSKRRKELKEIKKTNSKWGNKRDVTITKESWTKKSTAKIFFS
jgi:hypothetical protein